jgi:CRISPR-associated protein Csd1
MLLRRLKEYADVRMQLPPVLYSEAQVRYIIELNADGRLLSPRPTDTADSTNAKTKRGQRRLVPQIQRTVGIKPLLLADKADYTLGLGSEGAKPERVQQCHDAYLRLVERCAAQTQAPKVVAVLRFLQDTPTERLELPADFDYGALITFRVDETFVVDVPAVQAFWAKEHAPAGEATTTTMQCLICGQQRPILDTLQAKVKGVPGGQTSGTSIISANAKAFESYGLEGSLIAPTCADCGERFTKALNHLLADPQSRIFLGGAVFTYWTHKPVDDFDLLSFLDKPEPEEVKRLYESLRTAQRIAPIDETAFYAISLSGSGGRTVVRDWIDTTVGEAKANVLQWFTRQRIVGAFGEEPRPLGLFPLAVATVRESKDIPPTTPRTLLRSALTGAPLPLGLLFQAVRRNRAEQKVTAQRAALIKLVFASQSSTPQEDFMVQLDPTNPSAAYQCGRLLAVLEDIQRAAIPNAKATIVDRFFGTASSAPASVFGRLMRGAQPHLAKLERDNPNAYRALQRRMEEVTANLNGFPRTLTLEEQGLFSLGYYHQRAHDRAEAKAAGERKRAAEANGKAHTETTNDIPA